MQRVSVVTKRESAAGDGPLARLLDFLVAQGCEVVVDRPGPWPDGVTSASSPCVADECELVVALGGDGTLIRAARLVGGRDVPILGVNLGRLGFLAEITVEEMIPALQAVFSGNFTTTRRSMLRAELHRGGRPIHEEVVLNDVVVSRGANSRMIALGVHCNRDLVARLRGDGLILSSPTGSTAYSMAAGGPILYPTLECLILTPLCPHSLTMRPIAVPDRMELSVELLEGEGEVLLSLDGNPGLPLKPGDVVRVRRAKLATKLIRSPFRSYFDILREKLNWGV